MIMVAVAFAMVLVIVYAVRRLSIDYAWPIAIIVGVLSNIVILIVMEMMYDVGLGIGGVLLGSVVAGVLAYGYTFFSSTWIIPGRKRYSLKMMITTIM